MRAGIRASEAARVHAAAELRRALIEGWGGDNALEGGVRRVEPYGFTKVSALGVAEQRVKVIIDIAEPAARWLHLGHGYRVEPRIVLWESGDVLKVPLSSLFRHASERAVFVERDGRARLQRVTIGHMNGIDAEVLKGWQRATGWSFTRAIVSAMARESNRGDDTYASNTDSGWHTHAIDFSPW